jgi:hypothetical protein
MNKKLQLYKNIIKFNLKKENSSYLIRHIDGNTLNNCLNNLKYVNIEDTINNINNWKVDWIFYLPEKYHKDFIELCNKKS